MNQAELCLHEEDGLYSSQLEEFARDVCQGLNNGRKSLPCKYIYDDRGSRLFAQITELPEYYLTRCERDILEKYKEDLACRLKGSSFHLVELGAGDGNKTRILLSHLMKADLDVCYIPIDICRSPIENLIHRLNREFGGLKSKALAMDYFQGLHYLSALDAELKLVLFLGSSIGNMHPRGADHFLSELRTALNINDHLLIGFDLKKDIDRLLRAYNDSQGITAAFNKNLLHRINRDLGGSFVPELFNFYSTYDAWSGVVQSYLISTCPQTVYIKKLNRHYTFKSWEAIHTESSYKYDAEQIRAMAETNGFEIVRNYMDDSAFFMDSLWRAA